MERQMLILSRKAGDAILIDGGIRIVVLASDNGGVRLGIEAPASVGIVREEIVDKIADENRRSQALARRLGAQPVGEAQMPGSLTEYQVTDWRQSRAE